MCTITACVQYITTEFNISLVSINVCTICCRSGNNITLGNGTSQVFENQLITYSSDEMNSNNFVGLTVESNVNVDGYWRFLRDNGIL